MVSKGKEREIIEATDIVDLVGGYISLEKVGNNYRGLCPFHDDHKPSFSVSPTKKLAMCMTCKAGGNPISFIQQIDKISRDEACLKLAKKYNVSLDIKIAERTLPKYQRYLPMMSFANEFYQFCVDNTNVGIKAQEYLKKRGIDDNIIAKFKIGLAVNQRDVLYKTLKDKGFTEMDMIEAGLVKKNNDNYYDTFTNRILFPIIDEYDSVLGFSGRIYEESNQPKYINSPDSIIFNKGKLLYNINNATNEIRRKKRVLVYEGFMDVITSYKAGIKEAVCAMGTALSKEHVTTLKKYTNKIILCLDGDDAGQNAIMRSLDIIKSQKVEPYVLIIPDKLDPDEYIKKNGADAFKDLVDNNVIDSLEFSYIYCKRGKDFTKINDVEKFKKEFFKYLKGSKTLVALYLQKIASDLNVSYDLIASDFGISKNEIRIAPPIGKEMPVSIRSGVLDGDKRLLKYMLKNETYANQIKSRLISIEGIQDKYLDMSYSLVGLIYGDPKSKYCISPDNYFMKRDEFVEYLFHKKNKNEDDFYDLLPEDLKSFYLQYIKTTMITPRVHEEEQEINDCLNSLEKFMYKYCAEILKKQDIELNGDRLNSYVELLKKSKK